jgi:hypothetical protein
MKTDRLLMIGIVLQLLVLGPQLHGQNSVGWDCSICDAEHIPCCNAVSVGDSIPGTDSVGNPINWPTIAVDEIGLIAIQSYWLKDTLHYLLKIDSLRSDSLQLQTDSAAALVVWLYYLGPAGETDYRLLGIEIPRRELEPMWNRSGDSAGLCIEGNVPCDLRTYRTFHHWGLSWNLIKAPLLDIGEVRFSLGPEASE